MGVPSHKLPTIPENNDSKNKYSNNSYNNNKRFLCKVVTVLIL